jgi:ABC-2 type transport system ATP-binding protein
VEYRVTELSELLQVQDKLDVMVRELSLGERMKFELIAALLHRPKVLLLDEPTLGLDVVAQRAVRDFLKTYNETYRTTVLLTSHYMSDIEALCQRVIIIDNGQLFFDGSLADVMDEFAHSKLVTVHFDEELEASPDHLEGFGDVLEQTPDRIKLQVPRARVLPVCRALLQRLPVADIDIEEVPIEDVIGNIFTRGGADWQNERTFQPTLVAA